MNIYTIQLPKDYPRQEALLRHLQKAISEYDAYFFQPSEQPGLPKCLTAKTDPDFVMTDQASGRQFGIDGRHVDEEIEKFEADFPSEPNQD
jgi:hypothetical protein